MSKVSGVAGRGKGRRRVTIRFKGKLAASRWAEFKRKLRDLVNKTQGVEIHTPPAKRGKKKKS